MEEMILPVLAVKLNAKRKEAARVNEEERQEKLLR